MGLEITPEDPPARRADDTSRPVSAGKGAQPAAADHLLAQQLLAAGEQALDVPPKLGALVLLPTARGCEQERTERCPVGDLRGAAVGRCHRGLRPDDHAEVPGS